MFTFALHGHGFGIVPHNYFHMQHVSMRSCDLSKVILLHVFFWSQGSNPNGMVPLQELVAHVVKTYVHNVELCSSPDNLSDCAEEDQDNGFFMTMDQWLPMRLMHKKQHCKLSTSMYIMLYTTGTSGIIRSIEELWVRVENNGPWLVVKLVVLAIDKLPGQKQDQINQMCAVSGVRHGSALHCTLQSLVYARYFHNYWLKRTNYFSEFHRFLPQLFQQASGPICTSCASRSKAERRL